MYNYDNLDILYATHNYLVPAEGWWPLATSGWGLRPFLVKGSRQTKKVPFLWIFSIRALTPPPPPYFQKLWNRWYTFDFGNKKGEKQNLPKTPKMAIFKRTFFIKSVPKLWNMCQTPHPPQIPELLVHNECVPKLWIGSRPPPLPYGGIP